LEEKVMAVNKKSFLLYCDIIHTVKKLSKEQAGELFLTILSYVNDENPNPNDQIIDLVFEPIKQQLKRDLKNYEMRCDRNKENGLKGGRPPKTEANQTKPKKPIGLISNPEKPKKADNDIDTDNDNDIDIDNGILKDIPQTFFKNQIEHFAESEYIKEYEKLTEYMLTGSRVGFPMEMLNSYSELLTYPQYAVLRRDSKIMYTVIKEIIDGMESDSKYWKGTMISKIRSFANYKNTVNK
jgi:hypothetical protein